jgi:hypothetical protein
MPETPATVPPDRGLVASERAQDARDRRVLVSRNVADFEGLGATLVNPFR